MGRTASWKLTSAPRPMLPSLGWLLTRCTCGAARRRRDRAFSLRLEDRRSCRHRIDRTLATAPEKAAPPRPTPALTRDVKATAGRARGPHRPRIGSARGFQDRQLRRVDATNRPQARACQLVPIFFTPQAFSALALTLAYPSRTRVMLSILKTGDTGISRAGLYVAQDYVRADRPAPQQAVANRGNFACFTFGGSPCSTRYLKAASVRGPTLFNWKVKIGSSSLPSRPPFRTTSASLVSSV
jgi:hypothetical protein